MATNATYDKNTEANAFNSTFEFLDGALGDRAFKRWNGQDFTGKFLMSVFEVLATGVSRNVETLQALDTPHRIDFITESAKGLWANPTFIANSGAGVRGTTRLARLLPIAADLLNPPL